MALEARRAEARAAAADVAARKRMLGNIIFVGQLYRQGVLTEQVMTQCIQQLLEEVRGLGATRPRAPLPPSTRHGRHGAAAAPARGPTASHNPPPPVAAQTENPRPEDVECLCKLLTTIGKSMDMSSKMIKRVDGSGSDPTRTLMGVRLRAPRPAPGGEQALQCLPCFELSGLGFGSACWPARLRCDGRLALPFLSSGPALPNAWRCCA